MDDEINTQLKTALENLPPELRQFVASGEWHTKFNPLLEKYSLAGEPAQKAADEVLFSLIGITDPDDLVLAFQTMAGLSQEQAEKLADEVEIEVLAPVSQHLVTLNPVPVENPPAEQHFNQLPAAVQEAIVSVETENIIQEVGKKYRLHIDQIGILEEEITSVMLGLTPYYQFMDNIQKKLGIDRAAAENITLDINTEIFLPIREFLKQGSAALPSREEVLKDIENPPPTLEEATSVPAPKTEAPTDTIFEQKMAKTFKLPREETPPAEPEIKDPYLEPAD